MIFVFDFFFLNISFFSPHHFLCLKIEILCALFTTSYFSLLLAETNSDVYAVSIFECSIDDATDKRKIFTALYRRKSKRFDVSFRVRSRLMADNQLIDVFKIFCYFLFLKTRFSSSSLFISFVFLSHPYVSL